MSPPSVKPSPKSPNCRKIFKLTLPTFPRRSLSSPKPSPRRIKTKIQHLREIFLHFDADRDGKISADELRSIFGFNDFVAMMTVEEDSEEELRRTFEEFEEEKGSGRILPAGLQRVFNRRLGEDRTVKDCEAMIRPFDLDGDGGLDFCEFKTMMTR